MTRFQLLFVFTLLLLAMLLTFTDLGIPDYVRNICRTPLNFFK
jgi:hypothetical protein